jgi:hypothetical protein
MRIKDEPTDLGLGFTLELKLKRERKEVPWNTEDVAQRPSLGHKVT